MRRTPKPLARSARAGSDSFRVGTVAAIEHWTIAFRGTTRRPERLYGRAARSLDVEVTAQMIRIDGTRSARRQSSRRRRLGFGIDRYISEIEKCASTESTMSAWETDE